MSKIIVAYSYTGNCDALAQSIAKEQNADYVRAKDTVRPGSLKAYTLGCLGAMRGTQWSIGQLSVNLAMYDEITIVGPIWGGSLAPQVNSILALLPKGKVVRIIAVSGGGRSSGRSKALALVQSRGSTLETYRDTKANRA